MNSGTDVGEDSVVAGLPFSEHATHTPEVTSGGTRVKVAGVGSPSSSSEIVLDLNEVGRKSRLVGATVAVVNDMGVNGQELGIGTVTEVVTHNKWHEDSTFRGASGDDGVLSGLSGDAGDQREAKIRIQASWSCDEPGGVWIPRGTQLGMSPATGTGVYLIDQGTVDQIIAQYHERGTHGGIHYDGYLGGADKLPLPLNIPDNATPLGALHYGVFGRSGSGKALSLSTPIFTPTGWSTMGDLSAGDSVYSDTGEVCTVTETHPVQWNKDCYRVEFSDGSSIVADGEHWWTVTVRSGTTAPHGVGGAVNASEDTAPLPVVPSTDAVLNTLSQGAVSLLYETGTPLPASEGWVTVSTDTLRQVLTADAAAVVSVPQVKTIVGTHNHRIHRDECYDAGYYSAQVVKNGGATTRTSMYALFERYLTGSPQQRETFLSGLLDANSSVDNDGVRYYRSSDYLHSQLVVTVLSSLGKGYTYSWEPTDVDFPGDPHTLPVVPKDQIGREVYYYVHLTPQAGPSSRTIVRVVPVPSEPVRCITVDSPSRLYLAGNTMIPTHNTVAATYALAGQLRHEELGLVIVDPQGQWNSEHGFQFSFQGFAEELGRTVNRKRVSEDLRLQENATFFQELLNKTSFYSKLRIKHQATQIIAGEEIVGLLQNVEDWSLLTSTELLTELLRGLQTSTVAARIYTTDAPRDRFLDAIDSVLNNPKEFRNMLAQFHPIANLFQPTNSFGGARESLWHALESVFTTKNGPAPILIIDMSSRSPEAGEQLSVETESSYTILDNDRIKAAILRNLFATLKRASEHQYRNGDNLNTMIVLDEAWRYAAPLNRISSDEPEIADLSKDLAGYARDTRKFGISWFYISQSPRSINPDIWEQLHIFMFGTGLNGNDLDKATEAYEDRIAALRLYKGFGNPIMTGIWPFLLQGPISPLMSANAPLVLHMYNNFDEFRDNNSTWISALRHKLGKPTLTGTPTNPHQARTTLRRTTANDALRIIRAETAHRNNLTEVGLDDPTDFTDPLGLL